MKKKLIAVIVSVSVVLAVLATVLIVGTVRNKRPPSPEEVLPRAEQLVTASRKINEVFFGKGLETYPYRTYPQKQQHPVEIGGKTYTIWYYAVPDEGDTGETVFAYQYCLFDKDSKTYFDIQSGETLPSAEAGRYRYAKRVTGETTEPILYEDEKGKYVALPDYVEVEPEYYYTEEFTESYVGYDVVRQDCGYASVSDMKEEAEKLFSRSYLDSVYTALFTGITVSDRVEGTLQARYLDYVDSNGEAYILKANNDYNKNAWNPVDVNRVFDFSTAKMVKKKSSAKHVRFAVETYLEGQEQTRLVVHLDLVLENGQWLLDSPTY